MSGVKIQKVDGDGVAMGKPATAGATAGTRRNRHFAGTKTYPHGIMKGSRAQRAHRSVRAHHPVSKTFEAVKDPAKAPPLKKSSKGTLRILTDTGLKQRRKTIKQTVRNMSDTKVRETLKKSKIQVGNSTPPHIVREILEGGMEAGMIVAK
jgi:hypothetical protein